MKKILLLAFMVILLVWDYGIAATSDQSDNNVITVVAHDYSDGQIILYNPMKTTYTRVILRQTLVYDSEGRLVEGINVTFTPRVVDNWKGLSPLTFRYLVNCSDFVSPGNYTIALKFIGVMSDGDVNVFKIFISLRVLSSPIVVESAELYPNGSVVFLNDTLIGYVQILNVGHKNISANFSVSIKKEGIVYYLSSQKIMIHPGKSRVKIEVPITQNFDEGSYEVVFIIGSEYGTQLIKKKITVSLGVEVYSVSLEQRDVYPSDELDLYVTILSSRNALVSVLVKVYKSDNLVWSHLENVSLEPGMRVVDVNLPTGEPGNYTVSVTVSAFNIVVDEKDISYIVWSLPTIEDVEPSIRDGMLFFNVTVHNGGPEESGVLKYTITLDDHLIYFGSKVVEISSGDSSVSLSFPLSISSGGDIAYTFTLNVRGHTSEYSGKYTILVPGPTESSLISSTTPRSSTNETVQSSSMSSGELSSSGSSVNSGVVILAIILLSIVVVLWIFEQNKRKVKRRSRPKPKRRSPLGRFKRPKPPKFKGFKSLPKKR